jgi:hypothetical protein
MCEEILSECAKVAQKLNCRGKRFLNSWHMPSSYVIKLL